MHWKEKQGGGNVLGRDEGLHPTGAAGNLGSTALLRRLLPADAAKTIFLALILRTPPSLPSPPGYRWRTVSWGNLPSLARFLEREKERERRRKYLTTFVFPRAVSGRRAAICAPRSPALGLTLLCQQEEVWREHGAAKMERRGVFQTKLKQNRENPES